MDLCSAFLVFERLFFVQWDHYSDNSSDAKQQRSVAISTKQRNPATAGPKCVCQYYVVLLAAKCFQLNSEGAKACQNRFDRTILYILSTQFSFQKDNPSNLMCTTSCLPESYLLGVSEADIKICLAFFLESEGDQEQQNNPGQHITMSPSGEP